MRQTIITATLSFMLLLSSGCDVQIKKYQVEFFDLFDTYISFTAYTNSQEEFDRLSQIVYDELLRLHQLFDIYYDYEGITNLKTINDNAGVSPVQVDASIIDLLELARQAYIDTNGTVNIAMGSVLSIWHSYRSEAISVPVMEELQAAALHIAIDNMVIDLERSTVFLMDPQMSLDVGALAKGYAAQCAIDLVKEAGLLAGILDAGGNICVVGKPVNEREYWNIGIQSPRSKPLEEQDVYDVVAIRDSAVVTSGNYQRFYELDGVLYHHIIDPVTLLPASRVAAVSIIHPDATTADILSTAAFILPQEEAAILVKHMGAEAIWIDNEGSPIFTDGYLALSQYMTIEIE